MKLYHYGVLIGATLGGIASIAQGDWAMLNWQVCCAVWCWLHAVEANQC